MQRLSIYDLETATDLSALRVFDAGDMGVDRLQPAEALAPMVERLSPLTRKHALTLVIGGNNAITRPRVHALDPTLRRIDVIERAAMPGAPGARPGGVSAQGFFDATRWTCEVLAGLLQR
jgi:arginase family enzyme